jgi:hypothetical protein
LINFPYKIISHIQNDKIEDCEKIHADEDADRDGLEPAKTAEKLLFNYNRAHDEN